MIFWRFLATSSVFLILGISPIWAQSDCDRYPFEASAELAEIYEALSGAVASYTGLAYSLNRDLTFCLTDTLLTERGYYEPDERLIVLARDMSPGLTLAVAVHELRHVEQFDIGICPSLDLSMKEHVRLVFAMEADASVTSLVVAADLRMQGKPMMWNALASWPMQADLAARFDRILDETSDVGLAASAAFEAWYDSDVRRDSYYVAVCSSYLDQIDREHPLPKYGSLSGAYFDDLCRLPDGRPYKCRGP